MNWKVQKLCTDINDYELIVEKQKANWHCDQARESWRWNVSYCGAVVAQGSTNDVEAAKELAQKNVPASEGN